MMGGGVGFGCNESDSSWTTYQSGCSRICQTWEWNSHSTNPWRSTPASGTPMIGPQEVGLRRRTGPRPHSSRLTGVSTSTGARRRSKPSSALPKERDGGTRRTFETLTHINTEGWSGSVLNTQSTTIAPIERDTHLSHQNASQTETYDPGDHHHHYHQTQWFI